jgi:hypothetical protein
MNPPLADWLKKKVHLVMRTTNVAALDGILAQTDATGVMIELLKGQSSQFKFVPWTSILHIDLLP